MNSACKEGASPFTPPFSYVFTSAARALLVPEQNEDWLAAKSARMAAMSAVRDLVRLPPCRATFQIVSRIWTVSERGEELLVVLDLAPGEPILSLV